MKILQVGNWYGGSGGVQNYIRDLGLAFQAAGHAVVVASDGPQGGVDHPEGWREYQISGLADCHRFIPDASARRRLVSILEHERPDVAYVHNLLDFGAASELLRLCPTVFFHHTHDLYCPAGSKLLQRTDRVCPYPAGVNCVLQAYRERCHSRRPLKLVRSFVRMIRARRWARRVDGIVVDTRDMQDRLVRVGFPADRIAVLPTPIRIPEKIAGERQTEEKVVLFVGRLTPHKGLRYLLEAMTASHVRYRLIVAGDGYRAEELKGLARRLGLETRVEFLGWRDRDDLDELYAACDVVVVPSVWPEPFGMAGPEAMAHGKPVVASAVGGIPEWLDHGRTGLLVPPTQVSTLAERIDLLLSDRAVAGEMGRAGRARAIRMFSHEKHVADLCVFLGATIERRRAQR